MSLLVERNGNRFTRSFRSVFSDFFDESFFEDNFFYDAVLADNVKEKDGNFEIKLAIPNKQKDDFKVDVDNGILSISFKKEEKSEKKDDNYTRKEFSNTSFKRSFALPENVDKENIRAKYKDGVLEITLQKKELTTTKGAKITEIQ